MTSNMGVGRGAFAPPQIWNFQQEKIFFVSSGKNQISPL